MSKRKSTVIKNWPRYILQWSVFLALILFITGIIPSKEPVDPEAYCPMGGLEALTTWVVNGTLPCTMSTLQIMMGIALAAAVILFSKLFCGYLCPLGTVQDLLTKVRRSLHLKAINIPNGSIADSILRIFKYILVFWIFYMTATASELFCKNFDPYYAVATGFKGEITLWMSIAALILLVAGNFIIDSFWCRYLCPLGAISNTLKFWLWIVCLFLVYYLLGLTGLNIPWWIMLGGFCLAGYLLEILHRRPSEQVIYMVKDSGKCNHCGACSRQCPYHIDIESFNNGKINSVDCTLCGECSAACSRNALNIGFGIGKGSRMMKILPALLTVLLVIAGIWAGSKFELPTIDMKWGIEQVSEDGSVKTLVDESALKTLELTGLKSVKCYGSSMAFKARLEKIPGIHGVKTFVKHHRAIVTYDPSRITPEEIQEKIFVPSKFRVNSPDPSEVSLVKEVTIRTEKMYDKLDINYLGMQMRNTGKKIYGIQTEFACPLIVRVYLDPSEEVDRNWFREVVEKKVLEMPSHGGAVKEIEVNFKFVSMEDGESYIPVDEYLHTMFSPFKAEFKSRVEENAGKKQFIYEIADKNYEKPIVLRNMPFLSNHLSRHDGIIGIYLDLNKDLVPAIQVRYAAPMTAEKVWELMTMGTWTITYSKEDVREVGAKMSFKTPGTEYRYE
ncbi:MAG: 4Fe-4S binding protein [Clostridium sp.]|nr:4Fe-4S binding protein [Bacteroides sp.]MCM1197256.1 4Fe-4S binding protein [Clostridium sp.]